MGKAVALNKINRAIFLKFIQSPSRMNYLPGSPFATSYLVPHNIGSFWPQGSLFPEGGDQGGAAAHVAKCVAGSVFQLGEVLGAGVGKFVVLGVAPDVFGGIQFRSVGGQVLDVDAALLRGHELLHYAAAMCGQPVPYQQQLSGNVPQQVFEKRHHLPSADRSGIQPEVEIPQRDARDDRKRLPVKVILQPWRVASPRPRAATVRPLAQSAFVEKDDRSPLFLGFFLMSGQVTFFQWRMACSLRSSARLTGRWQLQPSATRIFHTWPG